MVDQEGITTLTRHVRNFSLALKELRECFLIDEGFGSPEDIRGLAHNRLGEVVSILKGVMQRYPTLNPTEILRSAGTVIRKVKEHDYNSLDEPDGFFEATDQLALAFSNSVSDYLEEDLSEQTTHINSDITSIDHLQSATGYDYFDDKRNFSEMGGEFPEFYEDHSERAESEESMDKNDFEGDKRISLSLDPRALNENDHDRVPKPDLSEARAKELDRNLLDIEGSVDISMQRTKVWSKYAKDIISYMERRSHIEMEYCKQLSKLAQTTKAVIAEESYLPFQSTYITALEHDISYAKKCQEKLQQELKGKIIEQLTQRRNDHDRIRSKLKEKWGKECKKLSESVMNLSKAKSMYVQRHQELKKFVEKQEKVEGNQSSSVVPSFSIGKKKREEDIAKRVEEAEEYYRKCVDDANLRQHEKEKTRESVLLELRGLVYQCDMTMRAVTCGYFQMMEQLASPLPQQYSTLAKDNKQSEIGKQFAEFIKLQQTTSKKATPTRYTFEPYVADDRSSTDKGYIGPADFLTVGSPEVDQKDSPNPSRIRRRISTASAGSDTSLNRPSSPIFTKKRQNAWGAPNRYSNSDDTASVSSRSLPGSPSGSPNLGRKETSQRLSLSNTDMDVREEFKKELAGPFRKLKMSTPAHTHQFKKLRSSSKCKKCDSLVYFNGAECELCGLTCHKKCLETLAIKCGKSRLPRKMTTFGVDFQKHLNATKQRKIPIIMDKCITEIDDRCLQIRGIYRVSGVKTKVEALSQQFETGGSVVDLQSTFPHLITSVLKLYLRELPEPLMTFELYPEFIQIAKDSTGLKFDRPEDGEADDNEENDRKCEELLQKLHELLLRLPPANYYTVSRLLTHLRRVANNEEFNQMNCGNLAIIFGPTLLRPRGSPSSLSALMDMSHQVRVVELLLMNTKMLEEEFDSGTTIGEEKEAALNDITDESKDTSKRSSSTQSQDLGYNTQPDQLDDSKPELSLSDELQMDFADIFKRANSSGKEIASSFGSLDSVPDMSPDIDEELKDLVLRKPIQDRPKSLDFDDTDQVVSPQNLRSGSDSNLSFDSMSPVEIPDSSTDIRTDLSKPDLAAVDTQRTHGRESSSKREPNSGARIRRRGQVTLDHPRFNSRKIHKNDHEESCTKNLGDNGAEREQIDPVTNSTAVATTDGTDARLNEQVRKDDDQSVCTSSFEDAVKGYVHVELVDGDDFTQNDNLNFDRGNDVQPKSKNRPNSKGDLIEKQTDNVVLKALQCESIVEQDYEKEADEEAACGNIDKQETEMHKKQSSRSTLSIKVTKSSRTCRDVPEANCENPLKTPPQVAPKPMSPSQILDLSADSIDRTQAPSVAKNGLDNEVETEKSLNISGNTRKLCDRFNAESVTRERGVKQGRGEGDGINDSPLHASAKQSPSRKSEVTLNRSLSTTAKLVEKFTKEADKKMDDREDNVVPRAGVSVKEILKQFESGDEMDDDETQVPRKRREALREKISFSSSSSTDSASVPLTKEQKPWNTDDKSDEKVRNLCENTTRREPKFV